MNDRCMENISFDEAVENIVSRDSRYPPEGYNFVRESLDHTLRLARLSPEQQSGDGHVDGQQLVEGFRRLALERFGPMAMVVLEEWGIRETDDVGEIVFNLIDEGVFGKNDTDTKQDFSALFDFEEAFAVPFRPRGEPQKKD